MVVEVGRLGLVFLAVELVGGAGGTERLGRADAVVVLEDTLLDRRARVLDRARVVIGAINERDGEV